MSPIVRAVMWGKRNPAIAATEALAILFLITGFAAVTWKWREAVRERARSDRGGSTVGRNGCSFGPMRS